MNIKIPTLAGLIAVLTIAVIAGAGFVKICNDISGEMDEIIAINDNLVENYNKCMDQLYIRE